MASLNSSPEDILRDAQRLERLEAQMKEFHALSKRQSSEVAELATQLKEAQDSRYLNPLSFFLAVLALLLAAALVYVLWRHNSMRSSKPWWRVSTFANAKLRDESHLWEHYSDSLSDSKSQDMAQGTDRLATRMPVRDMKTGQRPTSLDQPLSNMRSENQFPASTASGCSSGYSPLELSAEHASSVEQQHNISTRKPSSDERGRKGRLDAKLPASLTEDEQSFRASQSGPSTAGFALSGFGISQFGAARSVQTEELLDIQEQADFFMSVNQPEQAIEVLKNHISDNVETSALAYMDLFDIYHRTNKRTDYELLRKDFNRVYNAQVPEFDLYGTLSLGLEADPEMLQAIQNAWSRALEAHDLIEEYIFRQPDHSRPPLDMTAYRELILLYMMTKELSQPGLNSDLLNSMVQGGDLTRVGSSAQAGYSGDEEAQRSADLLSQSLGMIENMDFNLDEPDSASAAIPQTTSSSKRAAPLAPIDSNKGLDVDLGEMDSFGSVKLKN